MPVPNEQVKIETRVDKISSDSRTGRSKSTERSVRGSTKHIMDASLVHSSCERQSRSEKLPSGLRDLGEKGWVTNPTICVPVVGSTGKPLMPCHPARARELVRKGKALRRFSKGIYYVQLRDRQEGDKQVVAIGIDPGSKREGFTVKSKKHTYINILSDAVDWVKDAVECRSNMRRGRRFRKTPCRQNRRNRSRGGIPPSTKARWNIKLRIAKILSSLFPMDEIVVEDIAAKTWKNGKRWNSSFSPLEVGKQWFYGEISKYGHLQLKSGWETKILRDKHCLKKTGNKKQEVFSAHNVDSWVLAQSVFDSGDTIGSIVSTGEIVVPENQSLFMLSPIRFHRRQLHRFEAAVGGERKRYGGTISLGFKKGSIVKHIKFGICYVGGSLKDRICLHSLSSGDRITQNAKSEDLDLLCYNQWKFKQIR